MKIIDHISNSKETLLSFEILPPLKGKDIGSLYKVIDPMMEFKPSFVDVTYHREEFALRQRQDGSFDRIALKKRPGTVAICAAIQHKYGIDAVPHIICGGFTKDETENALIDLHFLGIDNVLALRGDNQKGERNFTAEKNGNKNSLDLIYQVNNMNNGIYLDNELRNPNPTDFCIGAAAYPEKHIDAPNLDSDLNFLKRKIDAGAEFITTQMFFDNQKYFDFVDLCRSKGIDVPIIPGIKPITRSKQYYTLPKVFNIDVPSDLCDALEKADSNEKAEEIGREWCINQCKELISKGVPVIHFYTMGIARPTINVVRDLF